MQVSSLLSRTQQRTQRGWFPQQMCAKLNVKTDLPRKEAHSNILQVRSCYLRNEYGYSSRSLVRYWWFWQSMNSVAPGSAGSHLRASKLLKILYARNILPDVSAWPRTCNSSAFSKRSAFAACALFSSSSGSILVCGEGTTSRYTSSIRISTGWLPKLSQCRESVNVPKWPIAVRIRSSRINPEDYLPAHRPVIWICPVHLFSAAACEELIALYDAINKPMSTAMASIKLPCPIP